MHLVGRDHDLVGRQARLVGRTDAGVAAVDCIATDGGPRAGDVNALRGVVVDRVAADDGIRAVEVHAKTLIVKRRAPRQSVDCVAGQLRMAAAGVNGDAVGIVAVDLAVGDVQAAGVRASVGINAGAAAGDRQVVQRHVAGAIELEHVLRAPRVATVEDCPRPAAGALDRHARIDGRQQHVGAQIVRPRVHVNHVPRH